MTQRPNWQMLALKLLYVGTITLLIFASFYDWAYDDPFITYRYAQNIAAGNGMVYNPGEHVLSTTTPLFTLVLAGLSWVWSDLPHLANLIGAFCLAVGGLLLWEISRLVALPAIGWAGLFLYPTFPLVVSTLGSETPLYLAFCLGAITAHLYRRSALAATLAAFAVLTRPDGILIPVLLAIDWFIEWQERRQPFPWSAVALFLILTVPWFLFSWLYYGAPLPVTLVAKQQQGAMAISQRFASGFVSTLRPYLRHWYFWFESLLALLGLAWMAGWVVKKRRTGWQAWFEWRPVLLVFIWAAGYFVAYTILGVSRYFWYYAPLVPGFIIAVGLGLAAFLSFPGVRTRLEDTRETKVEFSSLNRESGNQIFGEQGIRSSFFTIPLVLVLTFGQVIHLDQVRPTALPRTATYRAVGEWLHQNTPPDSSVGILEVGAIGYYAQRRVIDFAGLIQPEVAQQLTKDTTYADSARWAIQEFQPDYVVLHQDLFPGLEQGFLAQSCQLVERVFGAEHAYHANLNIYRCHYP